MKALISYLFFYLFQLIYLFNFFLFAARLLLRPLMYQSVCLFVFIFNVYIYIYIHIYI